MRSDSPSAGWLGRIERAVGFDLRYPLSSVPWMVAGDALYLVMRFALSVVLARTLGKNGYGTWSYVQSVAVIGMIATLPAVDQTVAAAAARGKDGTFGAGLIVKARFGMLGILFVGSLALVIALRGDRNLGIGLAVVAALLVPAGATTHFNSPDIGRQRFAAVFSTRTAVNAFVVAMSALAAMWSRSPVVVLGVFFAATSVAQGLACWAVGRRATSEDVDHEALKIGRRLTGVNVVAVVAAQVDRFVIAHFLSLGDLAIFAIAALLPEQLRRISSPLLTVALPKVAALPPERASRRVLQALPWLALASGLVGVALVLALPFIIHVFYAHEYAAAIPYAQAYVVSSSLGVILSMLTKVLFVATNDERAILRAALVYGVGQIVLCVALIPFFALWGAVAASAASQMLALVYCVGAVRTRLSRSLEQRLVPARVTP